MYFSVPTNLTAEVNHLTFLTLKITLHTTRFNIQKFYIVFMVTPCINKAEPFYYQLMHIMLKNTELLKHSKITLQHVSVYIETIFRELKSVFG